MCPKLYCYTSIKLAETKRSSCLLSDCMKFLACRFYRVVYQVEKQQCFSPDEVLRRARRRLGDTNYSLPRNNCEHFATDCKTGKPKSLQGWTFWEITGKGALVGLFSNHDQLKMVTEYHWLLEVKKILGLQTSVELKCSDLLQKGWTSFVKLYEKFGIKFLDLKQTLRPIVNTFMQVFLHDCKRGIREMAMPNLKEMELNCGGRSTFYNKFKISKFTLLIAVLTEGTLALNDIDEAFQRKMTNEISSRDYQETVLKRVTSGVSSVPMLAIGSAIGQDFTPGPILGAIIGGMVGNYLGKLAAGNVLSPVLMEVLPWVNLHY